MKELKIYIDLPDELEEEMYAQGLNLETLLQEEGLEPEKEEIQIEGEQATRGVVLYILLRAAEKILKEALEKLVDAVLEEAGDQILETAVGRALKPLLKWIKGNSKKEEKIVININVLVQKSNKDGKEILELQPLTKDVADKVEQILFELKKVQA